MGLASALSTALTGMNAAETTIDVVGNNVANANTVGFKSSTALFATQFLQTQSLGSGPTDSRGGSNPRQVGLGTKVAAITPDFTQGTIQISSNPSDLAIQGDGFFVVEGGQGEQLYTRNGIFKTNADNELVTITGQRLLGQTVDENFVIQSTVLQPLTIPLGATAVAQATENVFMQGTLTPTGDVGDTPEIIESSVFSDGTKEVPANLTAGDISVLSQPTPLPTTSYLAAGAIPAGSYTYKLVEVDATGLEGPPSAVVGPVVTDGTAAQSGIQLTALPAITAGFVTRNIYRADNGGAYRLVGTTAAANFADGAAAGTTALDESTLAQGSYSYYVTFYNSATGLESRPNAVSTQSVTVDNRRIMLENLPSPTGTDFNRIRIYRNSPNNPTEFRLLTPGTGLASGTSTYIDGASVASIAANSLINIDGPPISTGSALVDLRQFNGSTYAAPFQVGTLDFTGRKGGKELATKTLDITATTTVADLINFIEDAMGIQDGTDDATIPGSPGGTVFVDAATQKSTLQFTANMGTANAIEIRNSSFSLTPTAGTPETIDLSFDSTQTANGESVATNFIVYDSLGVPLTVTVTAVLESTSSTETVYRWYADAPANSDGTTSADISVGTGQIVFDGEGNVTSVSDSTITIFRGNVSSNDLEFDLDFSTLSGLAAEHSSLAASRQDGSAAGVLSSYIIGEDGLIRGVFSNGVTRDLGQIRLVRFANNAGLEQRGENMFSSGVNSGLPIEGNPGEQGIGSIVAGATELSNTDIGQNLIDLITASTQYRGGTRVITAVQQLLDELMNLRR
jgi:flagellar hook protein FlgE